MIRSIAMVIVILELALAFRHMTQFPSHLRRLASLNARQFTNLQDYVNEMKKYDSSMAPIVSLVNSTEINGLMVDAVAIGEKQLDASKETPMTSAEILKEIRRARPDLDLDLEPANSPVNLPVYSPAYKQDDEVVSYEDSVMAGPNQDRYQIRISDEVRNINEDSTKAEFKLSKMDLRRQDEDKSKVSRLFLELYESKESMHLMILDAYRDVLLSNNLIPILKERSAILTDPVSRSIFKKMIDKSLSLMTEVIANFRRERVRQISRINSICDIAVKYQHNELQFLEMMDPIRLGFDYDFLHFVSYEYKDAQKVLSNLKPDHPDYSRAFTWRNVMAVMDHAVRCEFSRRHSSLLENITILGRLYQDDEIRRNFFKLLLDDTHAFDLPVFKAMCNNMVEGIENMEDDRLHKHGEAQKLLEQAEKMRQDVELLFTDDYIKRRMDEIRSEAESDGQTVDVKVRGVDDISMYGHNMPNIQALMEESLKFM